MSTRWEEKPQPRPELEPESEPRPEPGPNWERVLSAARIALGTAFVVLVVVGLVLWLQGSGAAPAPSRPAVAASTPAGTSPAAGPSRSATPPAAGFARLISTFGGEGSGPGLIDDAREVAVDGDGDIWVADYEDGRVQEFDRDGRFRRLLQIPPEEDGDQRIITGMAADGLNRLYVAAGGSVFGYDSRTGRPAWRYLSRWPSGAYIEDLAVTVGGVLYGLEALATSNVLYRFSRDGKPGKHWDDIVQRVDHNDPGMDLELAIDGLGHFYISSSFGDCVYHYDARAGFVDRFGEEGDLPGQLDSPGSLGTDAHGHLYVKGFTGIDQYTVTGRFIDRFTPDPASGAAMGLTVDRHEVLYVVTSNGLVQKYQLSSSTS